MVDLQAGDFILTKNDANADRWHHVALCVGDSIVEAQVKASPGPPFFIPSGGVILTPVNVFLARYPAILIRRDKSLDPSTVLTMVDKAKNLVGTEYRMLASLFRHLRKDERGENCVSLVRKCYVEATNTDPRWHRPDDVAEDGILTTVDSKG